MPEDREIHVAIIDCRVGNMFSVQSACAHAGLLSTITSGKNEILEADAAILPGVGAFGAAMKNLEHFDLVSPIKDFIESGKPFLGICLGMQLLFAESDEFGPHKGLGIIEGNVVKFAGVDEKPGPVRVPHIGWNRIYRSRVGGAAAQETPVLDGVPDGAYMYFVHSYYVAPAEREVVMTTTNYEGIEFCSSVLRNNVCATQFHPEKSAYEGLKIYRNWAEIIKKRRGESNEQRA